MSRETKKSFVLYFDCFCSVSTLAMEQRGELFSALFEYAMEIAKESAKESVSQEAILLRYPNMSAEARMAFCFIAETIRRDTEKWWQKHERYAKAARERISKRQEENIGQYVRALQREKVPSAYSAEGTM